MSPCCTRQRVTSSKACAPRPVENFKPVWCSNPRRPGAAEPGCIPVAGAVLIQGKAVELSGSQGYPSCGAVSNQTQRKEVADEPTFDRGG